MILFLLSGCLSNFKSNSSEPDEFDLHELIDPDSYAIEDRIDLNIGEVCANPCTLTVETSSTIHAVEYYADDQFFLGFGNSHQTGFPLTYTFQQLGHRKIEALGFDKEQRLLNWDSENIEIKETAEPEEPSTTSLALVTDLVCENPCSFQVTASADIATVEYSVDSWFIGSSSNPSDNFEITYAFSQIGERLMVIKGRSINGDVIAQVNASITIVESPGNGLPDVPYFYQYSNSIHPSSSCQNTSVAMLLAYFGWNGVPDDITAVWGKDYAQSPSGLAEVFNDISLNNWIEARLEAEYNGTIYGLQSELDAGHPTIIHGYFTHYGHVLVVLGYDEEGYWVNDPAGQWNQTFGGGYPYGWNTMIGDSIYYDRQAFEQAVGTWEGYTTAPLWYHKIR